jgi:hypothetical protein
MKVGIATSVSVDHATPSAFYAHQGSRNSYYNIGLDLYTTGFDFYAGSDFLEPYMKDKKNLYELAPENGYVIARGYKDYLKKSKKTDKIILLQPEEDSKIDRSAIPYAIDRKKGNLTLQEITRAGINFLTKNNDNGFFLMVEGGKIDWACHANDGATAFQEVIDFDNHGELFDKWKAAVPQQLYDRLVVEQSQSGGFHVAYRCKEEVKKGDKLAYGERNGRRTTLIETRAEGNVILCAPSDGYVLKQGDWRRLPLITADERGVLLATAKAMDECQEDSKKTVETPGAAVTQTTSIHPCNDFWEIMPIDDFKQRGDIHPYLEKAGWVLLRTDGKGE